MPQIGTMKRGREIGKVPHHLFVWTRCPNCNKEWWQNRIQSYHPSYTGWCRKCSNRRNGLIQGPKNKKLGRKITSGGYIEIVIKPDNPYYKMVQKTGYIEEHRLVMAQSMGRCLSSWEWVHHKDGKKTNNAKSNLKLVDKNSHKIGFADAYQKGYENGYADAKNINEN